MSRHDVTAWLLEGLFVWNSDKEGTSREGAPTLRRFHHEVLMIHLSVGFLDKNTHIFANYGPIHNFKKWHTQGNTLFINLAILSTRRHV